ncbi:unnamed protein product [Camellia sinensis]
MQSRAGSAILRLPEEQALMMGMRMNSESAREGSTGPPSWRTPGRDEVSRSDWLLGVVVLSGVVGLNGVDFSGEVRRSRTDLHWWTSLECLRQEPFLMILSRAGVRIWFRRESASEEAIPGGGVVVVARDQICVLVLLLEWTDQSDGGGGGGGGGGGAVVVDSDRGGRLKFVER